MIFFGLWLKPILFHLCFTVPPLEVANVCVFIVYYFLFFSDWLIPALCIEGLVIIGNFYLIFEHFDLE